ncbi:uncharacterized protein LOC106069819 isoform X3 [Biomphalaria glabrata]|uniref:Uncharacterized protein LOC106069819 isoform X2 n=1 Tax=Biomphalaria glabrata TaxID=6526 RepID=A0A9W3BB49_BIOGL|nr:uncharacterized protein LOC106069819 isoform X2 [Biomphalaria glabrata]XP_055896655.1 uncharacterized protein LOC106069819 isoform X3 [Biomphalaria glabrata]
MFFLQSRSRLVKFCVVSGAVTLVSFLAYYYTPVHEFELYSSTKRSQNVDEPQDLVTTMTATLTNMLQESTAMKPHNVTADCDNIWNPCHPRTCSKSISQSPEERIRDLLSPKLTLNDQDRQLISYLAYLIPENDVIFATGTSSSHYDETQAMVHSLHTVVYPRVQNMSFVLLDLGLTPEQRQKTEKSCRCQVISFPFGKVPSYFRELSFCAWKPVLIMACMMKARKSVVYQDASIYWKDTIVDFLDRGDKLGLQIWGGKDMHNIPVTTLKGTFDFFGEEPCAYLNYTSLQAGINVFKQTPFVVRTILEPWAKCALEPDCICPGCTKNHLNCFKPKKEIHICHRFDQSVLSIITTKLFSYERYRFHMPESDLNDGRYVNINRGQKKPNYFN